MGRIGAWNLMNGDSSRARRKSFWAKAAFVAAFSCLLPGRAQATINLVITPLTNTLNWNAVVDPSSPSAIVQYLVEQRFGLGVTPNPLRPGTTVFTVLNGGTNLILGNGKMEGSLCFIVIASDTASGAFDSTPVPVCHSYLHTTGGGNINGWLRGDAQGSQVGFNEQWTLSYFIDEDSLLTSTIYSSNTVFTFDANGFAVPPAGAQVVKQLVGGLPRSGELNDGSFQNKETWDSRDSSGTTVNNGLYFVYFMAIDPLIPSPTLTNPTTRYAEVFSIPIDLIRFTAFSTLGITPAQSLANVSYTLTGDATVRIVIAKPGRKFTIDAAGNIQALDATGSVIDTSTTSVVTTITFNRRAGTYSETWNGADSNGVPVSSGIYSVGISAVDGFGNQALNTSGNNGPLAGTIPVDRSASQSALNTAPPVITNITVGVTPIALTGGSGVAPFTGITFTLNAAAGTGANISAISLFGPAGPVAGGLINAIGNTVTYSTAATQSSTGTYTISIVAKDAFGNETSPLSFNFNIPTPVPPSVTSIVVGTNTIALGGGTQVSQFSTINFNLNVATGATVGTTPTTISTVTLFLNGVSLGGATGGGGNVVTYSTNTTLSSSGTYSGTISARDSFGDAAAPFPFSFAIPAPASPVVSTITVGAVVVSPSGGTSVAPFSSINFTLITAPGATAGATSNTSSTVTLSLNGVNLGGVVTAAANVVTYSTNTTLSSTGTYNGTITPRDSFGDAASPVSFSFTIPATPPPTVSTITVGAVVITPSGGTSVAPFSSINFSLIPAPGTTAGVGANISSVTLLLNGTSLGGSITAAGSVVTYSTNTTFSSSGTYSGTIIAKDNLGDTSSPVPFSFLIPGPPAPVVSSITVGAVPISPSGGTSVAPFSSINFALVTAPGATAGATTNTISTVTLSLNGVGLGGIVTAVGNVVSYSTNTIFFGTGTYSGTIFPRDSLGNGASPVSFSFTIPTPASPVVSTITVGAFAISPAGGTLVAPFSLINFGLATAPGATAGATPATISTVTLFFNGVNLGGLVTAAGNVVTYSTSATISGVGTYNGTIFARDSLGDAAPPLAFSFIIPASPPPAVASIVVGTNTIAPAGGTSVSPFSLISFNLITAPGATASALSTVTLSLNGAGLGGIVTAAGNVVTYSTNTTISSSGTYSGVISARDSLGGAAAPLAFSFSIPVPPPPVVSTITVGAIAISPAGGTLVVPFSSINLNLITAPGATAGTTSNTISTVTLFLGGVNLGGIVTSAGNVVTYSTSAIFSGTGTYSGTIIARDSFGDAAAPFPFTFVIPASPPPSISSVTVGAINVSLAGGSSVAPFSSISFTLNTAPGATAGSGANTSTVTVLLGGVNQGGVVTAAGNVVTYSTNTIFSSTGTYTVTIIARDSIGNAAAPFTDTFVVPAAAAGSATPPQTADAFKASVKPFPNPARGVPATVNFTLATPSTVDFDVFTLVGQRVFHQTTFFAAGAQAFTWNLVNDGAAKVASGVYIFRLTANDGTNKLRASKKLMVFQ